MTRILIEYQKHGTEYWDATGDRLFDAALQILKGHIDAGYIMPEEMSQSLLDGLPDMELVQREIDAMQETQVKFFAQAANSRLLRRKDELETEVRHARNAKRAIESGDGNAAWAVLAARKKYEYENVALVELIDPRKDDGAVSRSWEDCESELEVVRGILRDAPPPESLDNYSNSYTDWYLNAACEYLETVG